MYKQNQTLYKMPKLDERQMKLTKHTQDLVFVTKATLVYGYLASISGP